MNGTQPVKSKPAAASSYLHLMPHQDGIQPGRWHVFQVSDASPRISFAATVASWDEARALAARAKRPLRIAEQAWRQMASTGVAPDEVPDEVTLA